MPYQFQGVTKFLQMVAANSSPMTVARARQNAGLSAVTNLLNQAVAGDPANRNGIMVEAHDRLRSIEIAYQAAVAMVAEVEAEFAPVLAVEPVPPPKKGKP